MKHVVHVAPDDIRRMSVVLGETLHIWVGSTLDEVARERYIQTKLDQYGIKRRRGLIPLLPLARHTAGHGKNTAATIAVSGCVIAVGVAAATVLPAALHSHSGAVSDRPQAAGPAEPEPPAAMHPRPALHPPKPHHKAHTQRSTAPSLLPRLDLPVRTVPISTNPSTGAPRLHVPVVTVPIPMLPPSPPSAVKPPPGVRKTQPLLTLWLPHAGLSVRLNPRPVVHIRIGPKSPRLGIGCRRSGSNRRGPDAVYGSTR